MKSRCVIQVHACALGPLSVHEAVLRFGERSCPEATSFSAASEPPPGRPAVSAGAACGSWSVSRRDWARLVRGGAVALLFPLLIGWGCSPGSSQAQDGPQAPTASPDEREAGRGYRRQRVINQTLFRDPDLCLQLERFQQQLQAGRYVEAAELYQRLLCQPHDTFTWREGNIYSLRESALQLVEEHPRFWRVYEDLHGQAAELSSTGRTEESRRLVARQYFHTAAGFRAVSEMAAMAWDRGDLESAAHLWNTLVQSRFHAARISARQWDQIQLIADLTEDQALQTHIARVRDNKQSPPRGEIRTTSLTRPATGGISNEIGRDRSVLQQRFEQAARLAPALWPFPHQAAHDRQRHAQTPPIHEPAWGIARVLFSEGTTSLGSRAEGTLRTALEHWATQQHEQLSPELTALFAVVAGDVLVYRDLDAVQAIRLPDPRSGWPQQSAPEQASDLPLWRYASRGPLADAVNYEMDPFTGVTTNHPSVDRMHLANSLTGSLTTDGQQVYFVDRIARIEQSTVMRYASLEHSDSTTDSPPPRSSQPDSPEVRLCNRLVAMPIQPAFSAGDGTTPQATASKTVDDADANSETETDSAPVPAWSIGPEGWQSSAAGSAGVREHPLSGHYFLGPPVVRQRRAFVMSEQGHQFWLSALSVEQGELLWSQPISHVDRRLDGDIIRATRACLPVCAGGLVLCDNGNGLLVAVDASLGSLQWVHCYADDDPRQDSGRWTYTQSTRVSQPGVLNLPIVSEGRVYLLPDRSVYLQCCNLQTGQLEWTVSREDAEYLAAVEVRDSENSSGGAHSAEQSRLILAVGARKCRALHGESGYSVWETPVGFVSGHGVQVGNVYLLPVSDHSPIAVGSSQQESARTQGRVLALDLATGERFGCELSREQTDRCPPGSESGFAFPLGNLLACRDQVIAVGINQIISFPQAGAVVSALEAEGQQRSLSERELQRLASAELVLGNISQAKSHLQLAMRMPTQERTEREQTRSLYRELLYRELREQSQDLAVTEMPSILRELKELAESPEQEARFLLTEMELLLSQGHSDRLWLATERFTELGLSIPLAESSREGHVTTSASWLPSMYDRIFKQLTPREKQQLLGQIEQNWLTRLAELSTQQLETIAVVFSVPEHPSVAFVGREAGCAAESVEDSPRGQYEMCTVRDLVRLELIGRALRKGDMQQVESRLLELRRGGVPAARLLASQGLVNLYSRVGNYRQAGRHLRELTEWTEQHGWGPENSDWARLLTYLSAPVGTAGNSEVNRIEAVSLFLPPASEQWLEARDYLVHFDRQHPSWLAHQQQLTESSPPVRRVSIRETQAASSLNADPYSRRRLLHSLSETGYVVMQQVETGRSSSEQQGGQGPRNNTANSSATQQEEQHLLLVDGTTGLVQQRIALPGTRIGIANQLAAEMGHLFPISVEGKVLGVSLLTGEPVWERSGADLEAVYPPQACRWERDTEGIVRPVPAERLHSAGRPRRVELGPTGPGYCLIQTARALTCLDPLTGRLLWRRADLDPQGGLWSDRSMGIIADERLLVYFLPDQNSYTLLDTRTGNLVRQGRLEAGQTHIQRTRHAFGRKLMYLAVTPQSGNERRLRLWDPLQDRLELDESYAAQDLYQAGEQDLTLLGSDGRLRIYRPREQRFVIDLTLEESARSRANYLRVHRQGTRYLINMYQTQRTEGETGYTSRYTESPWGMTHINGPVIAVNAATGQLEWTRKFGNRSVIDEASRGLPFLVMCANYQSRPGDQERTLLVEVVDPATGETLTAQEDLTSGRLLLVQHDAQEQAIQLIGMDREISIHYGGAPLPLPIQEE